MTAHPTTCGIVLNGVHLSYPSSPLRTFSMKEWAFNLARLKRSQPLIHDVLALKDVNLEILEGERVGIIGPNGAGKTSLLKAIAGIYPLASGAIDVKGRIRSLFEINLGFEYDATGRENIGYRGLLMGVGPSQVREREQEIVAFADIGEFIDYPVKAYSAGMLVRLAFAISTSFGGDILLLDEVLTAGDAAFTQKARQRMLDLISISRILVFVSHDMESIRQLCTRAIYLHRGQVIEDGLPERVVEAYLSHVA